MDLRLLRSLSHGDCLAALAALSRECFYYFIYMYFFFVFYFLLSLHVCP